ncbi:MAG: ABC transporter permease subunit [Acidobacteriota bacterium]
MFIHHVAAVFEKELVDSARDRRSLISAFAYALLGPLLVASMLGFLADRRDTDRLIEIPVAGAERAPALMEYLRGLGASIAPPPADIERAVQRGDVPFVLVVPEHFSERYRDLRSAPVELYFDASRSEGRSQRRRLEGWIRGWGDEVASLRLLARGLDPQIVRPVTIEGRDLATPSALGAQILGSLPMFFLLATFVGGMSVAIDATAGERERGSLESLLAHSASTDALAVGKWLAVVVFNLLGLVSMLGISIVVLQPERFIGLGVAVNFGIEQAAGVLVLMIPLALMVPALQMVMAIFARSFKEAQTYLSLLILMPIVPGFLLLLEAFDIVPWMHAVPVLAQQIQIVQLIRGESISQVAFFAGALATLLSAVVLVWLVGRLLGRERIVTSR